jgi:hypothetical protein
VLERGAVCAPAAGDRRASTRGSYCAGSTWRPYARSEPTLGTVDRRRLHFAIDEHVDEQIVVTSQCRPPAFASASAVVAGGAPITATRRRGRRRVGGAGMSSTAPMKRSARVPRVAAAASHAAMSSAIGAIGEGPLGERGHGDDVLGVERRGLPVDYFGGDEQFAVIDGQPHAMASATGKPNPSNRDGNTINAAA